MIVYMRFLINIYLAIKGVVKVAYKKYIMAYFQKQYFIKPMNAMQLNNIKGNLIDDSVRQLSPTRWVSTNKEALIKVAEQNRQKSIEKYEQHIKDLKEKQVVIKE